MFFINEFTRSYLKIELERIIIYDIRVLHLISYHIPVCFFNSVEEIVTKVFDI